MIIFFSVPALLIVFVLLAFLGMADMLFTFLIDIVFALVMAGLSIWGFYLAFKALKKKDIWHYCVRHYMYFQVYLYPIIFIVYAVSY